MKSMGDPDLNSKVFISSGNVDTTSLATRDGENAAVTAALCRVSKKRPPEEESLLGESPPP